MITACSLSAKAQWSFDVAAVEAYISDHKKQRSLLLARATLEQSNSILHGYSSKAAQDYEDLNIDLDKYTRAFDVIDLLYQTLRTALNAYDTYNVVGKRIGDYKKMLTEFNELALKKGKWSLEDARIVRISLHCIQKVADETEALCSSMADLVLYATGAAACSTSDLMLVMESVNLSLDNIKAIINAAYFDTWRYIQVRIGYWKESIYVSKSRLEILEGAFGRWLESGLSPCRK